jgi:hypothetical protein
MARLGNQLVDRRHRWPSLPSFQGKLRKRNRLRRPSSIFADITLVRVVSGLSPRHFRARKIRAHFFRA